jgi:hypothetical protein
MTPCCFVCGKPLDQDRIEALEFLGTPAANWTCVTDSQVKPVKGLWEGTSGNSRLIIAQDLGADGIDKTVEETREED